MTFSKLEPATALSPGSTATVAVPPAATVAPLLCVYCREHLPKYAGRYCSRECADLHLDRSWGDE